MSSPRRRPNVLVFLTDDHGQWASPAYGNREIHAPTMRWIADTGVRFDHAFSPNPVCYPARATFWTGQIASRHGIHDWLGEPNEDPEHRGIEGCATLGSILKQSGYRTAMVGKWHAGPYATPMPGFDTWFTSLRGTNARFGPQDFVDGTTRVSLRGHQEIHVADRAVRFLREHAGAGDDAPFFLFVGFTNTHTPHHGEAAPLVHHYRSATFADVPREPCTGVHGHARIAAFDPDEPARREQLAEYYAAVEAIDQQMLRLVAELGNLGLLEDTVVVYTGDHGHMNGHHGLHTKTNATIPPNFTEETIHVPLLARGPGIAPGTVVAAPVDHADTFATVLDLAGLDAAAVCRAQTSPGRSWRLLAAGAAPEPDRRTIQCGESGPHRWARSARGKLVRRFPNPFGPTFGDEYFDLERDPRETTNRIAEPDCAASIAELDAVLTAYFAAWEDPAKSGISASGLAPRHNALDAWRKTPGCDDHRQ